jgi:hypothetical protein
LRMQVRERALPDLPNTARGAASVNDICFSH